MILPGSYALSIFLLFFGLFCWGSWINTFKMARGGWRFELYYLDFAIGLLVAALLAALTFGNLGFDGFSFLDDVLHAGKRQLLFGFLAGFVFNLANIFLVGTVSIAGMGLAFPICLGLALAIGASLRYIAAGSGNTVLLFAGIALLLAAVASASAAYKSLAGIKLLEKIQAGKAKSTKKKVSMKAVILGLIGGFIMGFYLPLVELAQVPEVGVGPYTTVVLLATGVFVSTFIYNLFFINLPVEGEPVEITAYFQTSLRNHLLGLAGGMIWCFGLVAILVSASAEGAAKISPALLGIAQAAPILCVLWGFFVWKEFAVSDVRVKMFLVVTVVLYLIGTGLIFTTPAMAR